MNVSGVNIDPIMVFGLKRDQSLDTATRRGIFHKRGIFLIKASQPLGMSVRHLCISFQYLET